MTGAPVPRDLVVLVADRDMEFAVKGLLSKPQRLGIHPVTSDIYVYPNRDSGCLLKCDSFLQLFVNSHAFAVVLFDRHGCGREAACREEIENEVEIRLSISGWARRSVAIVLDPELEVWVWSDSPHVESLMGWSGKSPDLRTWLIQKGFTDARYAKPNQPKKAVEQALRVANKARSSSLYNQLAQQVSLERCVDPSFSKLKATLKLWFPVQP